MERTVINNQRAPFNLRTKVQSLQRAAYYLGPVPKNKNKLQSSKLQSNTALSTLFEYTHVDPVIILWDFAYATAAVQRRILPAANQSQDQARARVFSATNKSRSKHPTRNADHPTRLIFFLPYK